MAITAIVIFVIEKISGLPAATPGAGNTRYARASFQVGTDTVWTSRSRPIPDAGGDFAIVPTETSRWNWFLGLDDATGVTFTIEIREDHGDSAPPLPLVISGTISGPWPSIPWNTTKTLGSGPTFDVLINPKTFNITDVASLARARAVKGVSASLAITKGFLLEITAIDGLYQPDSAAVAPTPGSKPVPGYLSRDNLGRIFTNRTPDGKWAHDTQYIEVKLKISAFGGAVFPGGAKVHWFLVDEDDPSNDQAEFHRDWGPYIDANDYDPAGLPTGAKPADNASAFSEGNVDEDLLFAAAAKGNARWAAGPGGEAPSPIDRTEATSPLTVVSATLATTSVRIHCPNVLGTNFSLNAGLDGVPPAQIFSAAVTGTMTMWSRIDVEVVRMAGAFSLAGALPSIPKSFLPMCVQMDCQAETVVTGAHDLPFVSPDEDHEEDGTVAWFSDPAVFTNRGKPGWFFMGGAQFGAKPPAPGPARKLLYNRNKYTFGKILVNVPWRGMQQEFEYVEVPAVFSRAGGVFFKWKDSAGIDRATSFGVALCISAAGKTRVVLSGNDVTPLFTGSDADGSTDHSQLSEIEFFPNWHRLDSAATLDAGGFNIPPDSAPNAATVRIARPGGAFITEGISPTVKDPAGRDCFAGRTVIFTHAFGTGTPLAPKPDFDQEVVSTVVHEFIHAHGMPHKCGYWDWRTPRGLKPVGHTCCMNYFNTWLIDRATVKAAPALVLGSVDNMGDDVCGRHLMEVRRVHLERNVALRW